MNIKNKFVKNWLDMLCFLLQGLPSRGTMNAVMAYMRVSGTRPDGRTYDQYQAYLYRFNQGKLVEGQTIPVDQMAFEQFFND